MFNLDSKYSHYDALIEARALLAVGIDGSVVVLQVNPENQFLLHDAALSADKLLNVLKFSPESGPQGPGLYEFKGYSALEPENTISARIIHRGQCVKVAC